jgi:hypothetical protein
MSDATRLRIRQADARWRKLNRKRRARPEDYEPCFDGPIRKDTSMGPTARPAWRNR